MLYNRVAVFPSFSINALFVAGSSPPPPPSPPQTSPCVSNVVIMDAPGNRNDVADAAPVWLSLATCERHRSEVLLYRDSYRQRSIRKMPSIVLRYSTLE